MVIIITYFTSTSGLLCLSTIWEGKFRIQAAACRVLCTASKYGFNTLTWDAYKHLIFNIFEIYIRSYIHYYCGYIRGMFLYIPFDFNNKKFLRFINFKKNRIE